MQTGSNKRSFRFVNSEVLLLELPDMLLLDLLKAKPQITQITRICTDGLQDAGKQAICNGIIGQPTLLSGLAGQKRRQVAALQKNFRSLVTFPVAFSCCE